MTAPATARRRDESLPHRLAAGPVPAGPGLRPAGPPRRARPGAGEHAARLRAGAVAGREHAGNRHRHQPRRRAADLARPGPQPRHHARPGRPVPERARAGDLAHRLRRAAALRRRPPEARHALRRAVPGAEAARRRAAAQAGGAVRAGEEVGQHPGAPGAGDQAARPTAPDETMAPEPFARALVKAVRDAGMAPAHDHPVLRLAHAAGGAEGGARDRHRVPVDPAAQLRQHRRRPARRVAVDRGLRHRRARLGAEDDQGRRRAHLVQLPRRPGRGQGQGSAGPGPDGAGLDGERPGAHRPGDGHGRGRHRQRPARSGARGDAAPRPGRCRRRRR